MQRADELISNGLAGSALPTNGLGPQTAQGLASSPGAGPALPNGMSADTSQTGAGPDSPDLEQTQALPGPPPDPEAEEKLFSALVKRSKARFWEIQGFGSADGPTPEEIAIVNHVIQDFESGDSASRRFKDNMVEMLGNWRGTTTEKDFPFDGCANVRVPLTASFVETMRARIFKALFASDYVARLSLLDKTIPSDQLTEFNQWFKWELDQIVGFRQTFKDILHNTIIYGTDLSIPYYKHEARYLHSFKEWVPQETESLTGLLQAAMQELLDSPSDWGTDDRVTVLAETKPGDYKLSDKGRLTFSFDEEKGLLRADMWKKETTFDGGQVEQVQLEDLVIANTAPEIDDLPFLGIRLWYSVARYRQAVEDGFFYDFGREENIRILQGFDLKVGELIGQQMTELQDMESGTDSRDLTANYSVTRRFGEIYRWEGWWVWDEEGNDYNIDKLIQPATQIAVWVALRSKRILRICRVEDQNKDGKRSGVVTGFIREPGRFYRIGLGEWLRHMQTIMDSVYNQRLDAGLLYNVPFGFYKPMSGLAKGAEPIRIEPGKFFPTADPMGVNMPRSNWQPTFSFAEEQQAFKYASLQAGLSDPATGMMASKRLSASEFAGTAQAIDTRSEEIVESIMISLRSMLYKLLGLYQQYAPRQRIFRAAGEGGVQLTKKFDRDRLQGKLYLEMTANLSQLNEQLVRQVDMDMLELLLNDVLIQTGVTGPDTIYRAIAKLAEDMHYTDVPLHKPQMPPVSDPPDHEEKQMLAGEKPLGPTLGENSDEHLQHHAMTAADKELQKSWPTRSRQLLAEHIQLTTRNKDAQALVARNKAAMATQMRMSMNSKGVRPGQTGGQRPGESTGAGSPEEGVANAASSPTAPTPPMQ